MNTDIGMLLDEASAEMPPARLSEDLWRTGRRLHRRDLIARVVALTAAVAALLVVPSTLIPGRHAPTAGTGPDPAAVPARVHMPFPWQARVTQAPPGPATVMFSGDGALRGIDALNGEDRVAVVGRDGSYRMLNYNGGAVAGEDVQLSPDGRYVAQADNSSVIDLTTGRAHRISGPGQPELRDTPVAWAPDGRFLLTLRYRFPTGAPKIPASFVLVALDTGATTVLADVDDLQAVRTASVAAFSPDGTRVALTIGRQVRLMDTTGTLLWTAELGTRRHLAGVGAFTADGTKITTVTVRGCVGDCTSEQLAAREWSLGYLDASTGADATGPAFQPVTAMAVRVLGWRWRTDPVVETYQPMPGVTSTAGSPFNDTGDGYVTAARLIALTAGGGSQTLLDPPHDVAAIDVPRDLVEAGRFGGRDVKPRPLPVDRPFAVLGGILAVLLVVVVLATVALVRGRRRARRPMPPLPYPALPFPRPPAGGAGPAGTART